LNALQTNSRDVSFFFNSDIAETVASAKRSLGTTAPVRLVKAVFTEDLMTGGDDEDLLDVRFAVEQDIVQHKATPHTTYMTMKQKRYKRKKIIADVKKYHHTATDGKTKNVKYAYKPLLVANASIEDNNNSLLVYNPTRQYRMLKKNKAKSEIFSVATNRRMLRTKRTLVIPAHVNITVISNSYDVVHS
jgi:hypothetical protein